MTFLFQMNSIGVILKMILALASVRLAIGGCFCSKDKQASVLISAFVAECDPTRMAVVPQHATLRDIASHPLFL